MTDDVKVPNPKDPLPQAPDDPPVTLEDEPESPRQEEE